MIDPPLRRCYEISTQGVNDTIKGYECYDQIAMKKQTDTETSYCPFNIALGEFAWVNEKN